MPELPEVLLALALCSLDWTTGLGCTINVAMCIVYEIRLY